MLLPQSKLLLLDVNHFIISQANPHAVMFASYNQDLSVWVNPVTGLVNSLLIFLKDQTRAWLSHLVELVGARRISPLFATQRDIGATFFTQEYEGRECDISLIPWKSHRGLFSAFLHCLYNPTMEEFHEWVKASELETWKHIPAIKSHIAEEVTLDRCVQRLRKRIVSESWAKKRNYSGLSAGKMGNRVPSFFTSPSLVNMSGLGIADQTKLEDFQHDPALTGNNGEQHQNPELHDPSRPLNGGRLPEQVPLSIPTTASEGWGGLGLHGNRSSGSLNRLNRTTSESSGFFIDGEEGNSQHYASSGQVPGEVTKVPSVENRMNNKAGEGQHGYFKTTSMAHFYYRKTESYSDFKKSYSDHELADGSQKKGNGGKKEGGKHHNRRKSQSQGDLQQVWGSAL